MGGDSRQKMQAVMEAQAKTLAERGSSGPSATALVIASGSSMGPAVDIDNLVEDADENFKVPGEGDVSDSGSGSDEEMSDEVEEYFEEGEEEEELEGSEEES